MVRWLAVVALVPGTLMLGGAPAHADTASYLGYLDAHGFRYQNHIGVANPDGAVRFGQVICQNLRHGRPAKDRFDPKLASGIDQVMIDAAQHELCPETLSRNPAPPGQGPAPGSESMPEQQPGAEGAPDVEGAPGGEGAPGAEGAPGGDQPAGGDPTAPPGSDQAPPQQ